MIGGWLVISVWLVGFIVSLRLRFRDGFKTTITKEKAKNMDVSQAMLTIILVLAAWCWPLSVIMRIYEYLRDMSSASS